MVTTAVPTTTIPTTTRPATVLFSTTSSAESDVIFNTSSAESDVTSSTSSGSVLDDSMPATALSSSQHAPELLCHCIHVVATFAVVHAVVAFMNKGHEAPDRVLIRPQDELCEGDVIVRIRVDGLVSDVVRTLPS